MVRHRSDSNHRYRSAQAVPDSPSTPRTPPSSARVLRSPSSRHRNSLYTPVHSIHPQQQQQQQQYEYQHQHQHHQQQQHPMLRRYYSRADDEADSEGDSRPEGNTAANKSIASAGIPESSDTTVGGDLYQSPNASLRALGNNNGSHNTLRPNNGHRSAQLRSRSPSPPTSSTPSSSSFFSRPSTRSRARHQQHDSLSNSSTSSTPRSSSSSPFSQFDNPQRMDISPNDQPTPSELLSLDLNVLRLASATSTPTSSARRIATADNFAFSGMPRSPSRGSSSTRAMLTSVHRYPMRTPPKPYTTATASPRRSHTPNTPSRNNSSSSSSSHNVEPIGTSPFLVSSSSPSPSVAKKTIDASAASSPGQTVGKFMVDEDHNLFLTSSPKAVRTPRKSTSSPSSTAANVLLTSPVPQPRLFSLQRTPLGTAAASSSSYGTNPFTAYKSHDDEEDASQQQEKEEDIGQVEAEDSALVAGDYDDEDDEHAETESIPSSVGGETEKENVTPKFSDDGPAFFIGGPYGNFGKRPYVGSYASASGSSGWTMASSSATTSGTGSSSAAASCSTPSGAGEGTSSKPGMITRSKRNALGAISPWRWNSVLADQILAMYTKGGKAGNSSVASCGSSAAMMNSGNSNAMGSSSSSNNSASAADDTNTQINAAAAASSSSSSSSSAAAAAASSSSSTSSSCAAGSSSSSSSSKLKIPELPAITPNPQLAKMAEAAVQPGAAAFTRRAQQVAGRIYYWKHGGYHLVSDQDKQTWPGEWKFEIFQDPDSPASTIDGGGGGLEGDSGSRSGSASPPAMTMAQQQFNRATTSPTMHLSHINGTAVFYGSSSSSSGLPVASSPSMSFSQGYPLVANSNGIGKGKARLVERPMSLGLSGPTAKRMRMSRDRSSSSSSSIGENSLGMEFSVESTSAGSASGTSTAQSEDPSETTNVDETEESVGMDVSQEYMDSMASSPRGGTPTSPAISSSSTIGGAASSPGGGGGGGVRTRAGLKRSRQSDPMALKFQDRYDFRERRMLNTSMVGGGRSRRR